MRNELEIKIAHLYRRAGFGSSREQLKNALTTVRRFRTFLRQHFKLDAL